jgi:hypothetical protein
MLRDVGGEYLFFLATLVARQNEKEDGLFFSLSQGRSPQERVKEELACFQL